MEKLISKATSHQIKSDCYAMDILKYVKARIIIDHERESDLIFIESLGICYQNSDGFVITDDSGKNYSVGSIRCHFEKNKKITLDELKKFSI